MTDYPIPSLVVLIGPPGAGKSTWLRDQSESFDRVSLEKIRMQPHANRSDIINAAIEQTFALLRDGKRVAFDSTAIDPTFRSRLRGIADTVGVPAYAVVFDAPLDELLAAQQTREHPVPEERVRELYTQFQEQLPSIYTERWAGYQTIRRAGTLEGGDAADAAPMIDTNTERSVRDMPTLDTETEAEPGAALDDETTEPAKPLCDWLGQLLGDVFTMYVQAHGYHWNVSGGKFGTFAQFHSLFGDIAGDVYDSIDPIAENILKLGYDAPATITQLVGFRELDDPDMVPDQPEAMVAALLASNAIVLDTLQDSFEAATTENQQGIANFLAERIDQHQKWAWQLRKTIDVQPAEQMTPMGDETIVDTDTAEEAASERAYSPIRLQYRASGAGKQYRIISGWAARTNSLSEDLGGFREIIAPGAFKRVLSENPDVRLLYNHDPAAVLARTGVNLELEEDELGLRIWARVDMNDPDVQRVASKLESGLVDAASFGFTVADDTWEERSGYPIRTIREIGTLLECSCVAWPAYPATRLGIMDEAIRSGRLHLGGAARTAPIMVGAMSRDVNLSGVGTTSAAAWRARLSLRKHTTQR